MTLRSILSLSISISAVAARQCYYPNGDLVTAEPVAPCYSWGGICCPVGWTCLSNNLCLREVDGQNGNQTGRYSCADRDWGKSCADFCRDPTSEAGNEAVQYCGDDGYCCNGRGLDTDQCCATGFDFFSLGTGKPVSAISTAVNTGSTASSGSASSQSSPTTTTIVHKTTQTQTSQSVSSSGSEAQTVQVTVVSTSLVTLTSSTDVPASASASITTHVTHSRHFLATAIGVPVGLCSGILLLVVLYYLYRCRYGDRNTKSRKPRLFPSDSTARDVPAETAANTAVASEFVGMSPLSARKRTEDDEIAAKEMDFGGSAASQHPSRLSELGGTEVLQLHEEPQIAELPAEGSGNG